MNYTRHESAFVDEGAQIGNETQIWHFVHVCAGANIGRSVILGQGVYVGNKAIIGDHCKIQNNVSIYDNVTLEEGVFCGPSVVFTNVHNPRSFIDRKNEYRTTLVQKGATLGANSTIICGVRIGQFAFVGAGALVTKDVKNFALVVGMPAVQIGWMSACGIKLKLPLVGEKIAVCEQSGEEYKLSGDTLRQLGKE